MLYHIERTGVNLLPRKGFEMYRLVLSSFRTIQNLNRFSITFNYAMFKYYDEKSKKAI